MKKIFLFFLSCFIGFSNLSALTIVSKKIPQQNKYNMHIEPCDWGPVVDYIYFNLGKNVNEEELNIEDFDVSVVYLTDEKMDARYSIKKGERILKSVSVCDEYGKLLTGKSSFVRIDFDYGPEMENTSPFIKNIFMKEIVNQTVGYRLVNDKLDFRISRMDSIVSEEAGKFKINAMTYNEQVYMYASWQTEKKDENTPLIIWLHGLAEGGTNPYLPLLGTKTVNLISQEIQQYFDKGACVLVPLCPTTWIETTSLDAFGMRIWSPVNVENDLKRITKPIRDVMDQIFTLEPFEDEDVQIATESYYTPFLMKMIQEYLDANPYIDRHRIYIAGGSAGGYMTLNMIFKYPEFFAAGIPVSEVYHNDKINDEQIKLLSETPLWFVHSKEDTLVPPEKYDLVTVDRIRNVGSENLFYSLYDNVIDTTNSVFDDEGNPYKYNGHDAWIYVLNNYPEENGVSIFEWLSHQRR